MNYIFTVLAIFTSVVSALNPVSPPKGPGGSGLIVDVYPSYPVTWEDGQPSDGTVCLWLFEYQHTCMAGFQIAGGINPTQQTSYLLTVGDIQHNFLKCVDQNDACENTACQALYPDPSRTGPVQSE
ncbi:hypothetical protein N7540_010027 [Penicillium herquei]|nr:hypothetical protein N7540_010027 [Penicillium herquei]